MCYGQLALRFEDKEQIPMEESQTWKGQAGTGAGHAGKGKESITWYSCPNIKQKAMKTIYFI